MKNGIFKLLSIGVFLFTALIFTNCDKEQLVSLKKDQVQLDPNAQLQQRAPLREWYDNGGTDYGCRNNAGTCADDVIITGKRSEGYNKLKLAAQGSANLQTTFSTYSTDANVIFGTTNTAGVINGTTTVELKGPKNGIVYWKFIDISTSALNSVIGINE
ncbi:MAG TPA: hypothetical protein PLP06_01530 [Saprospiraceae bacterium]|nr:hypothetical protein [Saprospiraceae bacterium]